MADLVIRGMEMPRTCIECRLRHMTMCLPLCQSFVLRNHKADAGRLQNCPLVPLPEGHGRLGDLDALFEVMGQDTDRWLIDDISYIETDDAISAVYKAPTIVPAEGGNTDG